MLEDFNKYLCDNFPFLIDSKFIIAMSSGVDSVVLSHLCYKLKLNFSIAHCNFSLRGKESDLDEEFIKKVIFKDIDEDGNGILQNKNGHERISSGQISIKGIY